jgi:hypothetical protein
MHTAHNMATKFQFPTHEKARFQTLFDFMFVLSMTSYNTFWKQIQALK